MNAGGPPAHGAGDGDVHESRTRRELAVVDKGGSSSGQAEPGGADDERGGKRGGRADGGGGGGGGGGEGTNGGKVHELAQRLGHLCGSLSFRET